MAATPEPDNVLGHWSTLIDNFQMSPLAFFGAVEGAIARRAIPGTKTSRIDYAEGGALSANREYLHVTRETLVFDVSAAPFGTGFFVSWWFAEARERLPPPVRIAIAFVEIFILLFLLLHYGLDGLVYAALLLAGPVGASYYLVTTGSVDEGIIHSIPAVGYIFARLFRPETYYRIDKMEMFQKAVHEAVIETLDAMTNEKGLRALSESERKPIMRDLLKR